MLISAAPAIAGVRFANADSLDQFVSGAAPQLTIVSQRAAFEESFFLGLRLNRGVSLCAIAAKFGKAAADNARAIVAELVEYGLMQQQEDIVWLTSRGRLLSNEIFQRFILAEEVLR